MTVPIVRLCLAACLASQLETAFAQETGVRTINANGTLTVYRPLSITVTAEMSFGRLALQSSDVQGSIIVSPVPLAPRVAKNIIVFPDFKGGPAIRTISGEPGRVYRISLPSSIASNPGGHLVNAFIVLSQKSGDISATGLGQFDESGLDILRIGATITLPKGAKQGLYSASIPMTITYE